MPERAHKIFRILTLNQISPLGLKLFDSGHYIVGSDVAEPDAILVRSHNMLQMDIPSSVKAIGRAGAGTNNVPVKDMNLRGVPVFNAPGANANAVKELVLAGLADGLAQPGSGDSLHRRLARRQRRPEQAGGRTARSSLRESNCLGARWASLAWAR